LAEGSDQEIFSRSILQAKIPVSSFYSFLETRKSNGQAMPNNLGFAGSLKVKEIFHSNVPHPPPLSSPLITPANY
jgi:hypothetical protein